MLHNFLGQYDYIESSVDTLNIIHPFPLSILSKLTVGTGFKGKLWPTDDPYSPLPPTRQYALSIVNTFLLLTSVNANLRQYLNVIC